MPDPLHDEDTLPPADPFEAELVAYLDGELEPSRPAASRRGWPLTRRRGLAPPRSRRPSTCSTTCPGPSRRPRSPPAPSISCRSFKPARNRRRRGHPQPPTLRRKASGHRKVSPTCRLRRPWQSLPLTSHFYLAMIPLVVIAWRGWPASCLPPPSPSRPSATSSALLSVRRRRPQSKRPPYRRRPRNWRPRTAGWWKTCALLRGR